jgi:hypothetical protein
MINGEERSAPMLPVVEQEAEDAPALPVAPANVAPAPVQVEADAAPDEPTNAEAVALAEDMTLAKVDRCEHGRVNECPKCGVERARGILRDDNGEPLRDENGNVRWKIEWRALPKKNEPIAAEAPKKYSHIDFTPPNGARDEAKLGLEWRKEFGRGGTEVGVARARDLSNGTSLSPDTMRRMKAYFDRHESDKDGEGFSPGEDGFPSAGRIAWALWGGDAGYAWARKVVRQLEAADESE